MEKVSKPLYMELAPSDFVIPVVNEATEALSMSHKTVNKCSLLPFLTEFWIAAEVESYGECRMRILVLLG